MLTVAVAVGARVAVGGTTVGARVAVGGTTVGDGADVADGGTTVGDGGEVVLVTVDGTSSSDEGATVDVRVAETDGTASVSDKAGAGVDRSAICPGVGRLASLSTQFATSKTAPKLISKSASPIRATITTIKSGRP